MRYTDMFIDSKLPNTLSEAEFNNLVIQMNQGDSLARKKIIEHNIKLVFDQINKRFCSTPYEKKDLASIGIIGLIKAVDTFDISKKIKFSSYASRCINNEILMFLRKNKHDLDIESIEEGISFDKNGNELKIEQTLEDKSTKFIEDISNHELLLEIKRQVEMLEEKDKKIIELYFGFGNNTRHKQQEIANILGLSRPYIGKLIKRIVNTISDNLQQQGLIENSKNKNTSSNKKVQEDKGEEKHLNKRGEKKTKLSKECEQKPEIPVDNTAVVSEPVSAQSNVAITNTFESKLEQTDEVVTNYFEITEEDYFKVLELLKSPILKDIIHDYSQKEAIILSLKLGFVDGKYFSTNAIAQFLDIDPEEVNRITKKFLIKCKEKLNQIADKIIQALTGDTDISPFIKKLHSTKPTLTKNS